MDESDLSSVLAVSLATSPVTEVEAPCTSSRTTPSIPVRQPPKRKAQTKRTQAFKPDLPAENGISRRGPGRPRKQSCIAPISSVQPTPPASVIPASIARPPSPGSPFFSKPSPSSTGVANTLPPGLSHQQSDCCRGTFSIGDGDSEYLPECEDTEFDTLVMDGCQASLEDDLDPGTTTASDGFGRHLEDKSSNVSSASASDVWYFMIPAATSPLPKGHKDTRLPGSYERPDAEVLECYLCRYVLRSTL